MTEQEALKIIKESNLQPIHSGCSLHVACKEYEIDGYLIKCYWTSDSDIENPMVEIYNIEKEFESDYKATLNGMSYLRVLPDSIYFKIQNKQIELNNENLNQNLKAIISKQENNWLEKIEWEIENKEWLDYSRKIAFQIMIKKRESNHTWESISELLSLPIEKVKDMVKGKYNFSIREINLLINKLNIKLPSVQIGN